MNYREYSDSPAPELSEQDIFDISLTGCLTYEILPIVRGLEYEIVEDERLESNPEIYCVNLKLAKVSAGSLLEALRAITGERFFRTLKRESTDSFYSHLKHSTKTFKQIPLLKGITAFDMFQNFKAIRELSASNMRIFGDRLFKSLDSATSGERKSLLPPCYGTFVQIDLGNEEPCVMGKRIINLENESCIMRPAELAVAIAEYALAYQAPR